MPEVKLKHIVSCNSEDPAFPSENLLKPEVSKKWKCLPGEKQATVLIQFEKSSQIRSVDIGNENSGFVEVLVGRESDKSADCYQVLVPASSFMSPSDGRSGTNTTRVRVFNSSTLTASVSRQKWDRLKIVCTQPFNAKASYGLSFIRLHDVPESPTKSPNPAPRPDAIATAGGKEPSFIGKFRLKSDEEMGMDSANSGSSLFRRRSRSKEEIGTEPRGRVVKEEVNKHSPAGERPKTEPRKRPAVSPPRAIPSPAPKKIASSDKNYRPEPSTSSQPPKKQRMKPYKQLFSDVVFTLSGFQNPMRGQIREAAMEMGAKYRPDWSPDSTHLICAFDNTPKMQQVRGKGKIVRKEFVFETQKNKKRRSWRRYAFDKRERNRAESEDEIVAGEAECEKPKQNAESEKKSSNDSTASSSPTKKTIPSKPSNDDSEEIYNMSTDEGSSNEGNDNGGDTDDEIERIRKQEKENKKDSSESEPPTKKTALDSDGLPILPDFFDDFVFFLYGTFGIEERKLINRYATAFGGKLVNYMEDNVTHVITHSKWDSNFADALKENSKLKFVDPEWILECGRSGGLQDVQRYLIEKH